MEPATRPRGTEPLLAIRGLTTEFDTPDGVVHAVNDVSYDVYPGETLGVVGESGSGKSVTVMSVLGLIPQPPGRIAAGEVLFQGTDQITDLLSLSHAELRKVRGKDIGMIFQDPMTSLNPVFTIGDQIAEAMLVHDHLSEDEARKRTIDLLELVGVPNPDARFDQYPHEYSGGMRQRAMIAMAIANQPKLLIADEPTTALDVTIQAQVLDVLETAKRETHAATILITHDLGLIAETADRVVVMYGGRVVESGDVHTIFHAPQHPYTLGLMSSLPRLDIDLERLEPIVGTPPSLIHPPPGCAFHPRCRLYQGRAQCREVVPPLEQVAANGHRSACHYSDEMAQEVRRVEEEIGATIRGDA